MTPLDLLAAFVVGLTIGWGIGSAWGIHICRKLVAGLKDGSIYLEPTSKSNP